METEAPVQSDSIIGPTSPHITSPMSFASLPSVATSLLSSRFLSLFLQITVIPGDAEVFYRYFLDWDGNELFKIASNEEITIEKSFEAEDGVVLMGCEPTWPSNAKIMKLDLKGSLLWETVLPTHLEHADQ